jgi:hypothetical protein
MPLDEDAPDEAPLTFAFSTALDDGASGAVSMNPYTRVHVEPFRGSVILTDGVNLAKEYDSTRLVDLEILAPSVTPTVATGSGGLSGKYKWKYRYKCSKTGKVSGFSPVSAETTLSTQYGTVTVTGTADVQVDKVEIFRSQNELYHQYFYSGEIDNPGATTDTYADTQDDDTISDNVADWLVVGKTFAEGRMWPVVRSLVNFGFVWYYGLIRMGVYKSGTVSVTNGSREVAKGGYCYVLEERVGQRITIDGDTTEYRITEVDATKIYVDPPVVRGTQSDLTYEIVDDRDGRRAFISEAGTPGSIPSSHDFTFGEDLGDVLHYMGYVEGLFYAVSAKNIFRIDEAKTEEPWMSASVTVVVDEGCSGSWAALVVPGLGLVYVEPRLGIRVFNGAASKYLGRSDTKSMLHDEWLRFNHARKHNIEIHHDKHYNQVVISYARDDSVVNDAQLVYDIGTGEWTGPWLRRINRFGTLETYDGQVKEVFGTDFGGLYQDHKGTRDGVASGTLSGTVTSVSAGETGFEVNDSTASFYATGEGLKGHPVEFVDGNGQSYIGWIWSNTTTKLVIVGYGVQPTTGWTYTIGIIPWAAKTGYIAPDILGQNVALHGVRFRLDRGASGSVACAIACDGGSFVEAQSGDESVSGSVYGRFRVEKRSSLFQVMLYGSNESELPKITALELIADIRGGERADGD